MMKELVPDRRAIPGLEWMEEGISPRLNPDSLVYVGLRDIDKVRVQAMFNQLRFCVAEVCSGYDVRITVFVG
jgi:hypothetical protein